MVVERVTGRTNLRLAYAILSAWLPWSQGRSPRVRPHPVSRHSSRQDTVDDVVQVPRRREEEATLDRPGRDLHQGARRNVAREVAHGSKDGNESVDLSLRTSVAETDGPSPHLILAPRQLVAGSRRLLLFCADAQRGGILKR